MRSRTFVLVIFILAFNFLYIPVANAYIDPGSGSFIFQMGLGGLLGLALAIKAYWRRIVGFFTRGLRGSPDKLHASR